MLFWLHRQVGSTRHLCVCLWVRECCPCSTCCVMLNVVESVEKVNVHGCLLLQQ